MPAEVGSLATVIEDEEAASAFAAVAAPASDDVSFDGCLGKMEAAFLCRSEERHQQMASRIVAQLAAIHRPQWSCAACCDSDGSGGAEQQPAASPLCLQCRWPQCLNRLPPAVLCRSLLLHVSSHVQLVRRLESSVKAFHRHNSTGQQFREDVRRACDLLLEADAADRQRISQLEEHSRGRQHDQQRQRDVSKEDGEERKEPQLPAARPRDASEEEKEGAAAAKTAVVSASLLRAVLGVSLLCCKFATENAPFNLRRSEIVKRKLRGLRLLLSLLQQAPNAFACSRGGVLLLRRFVCPSLLTACITDVPQVFRLVLSVFVHLDAHHRQHLALELAAFVDMMLLPLLDSAHTTLQQKRDIVSALQQTVLSSDSRLVELYYSYDNRLPSWKLFERIVQSLSRLCEADLKYSNLKPAAAATTLRTSRQQLQQRAATCDSESSASVSASSSSSARSEPSSARSSSSSSSAAADASASSLSSPPPALAAAEVADESSLEALRKAAIRLLVGILRTQARWIDIPGTDRAQIAAEQQQQQTASIEAAPATSAVDSAGSDSGSGAAEDSSRSSASASVAVPTSPPDSALASDMESAAAEISIRLQERQERNSTWMNRADRQRADARLLDSALRLARTESLVAACRFLKLVHPQTAWPAEIAAFLLRQEAQLDRTAVGELLSNSSDSLLSHAEYESLRAHYLSLLDFTGLSFDAALRAFLTSSGFRLPGEAQRIDRLLAAFCRAYCADCPGSFPSADAAFVLAFAMVMLNTDLHNASVRGRQPMTEQQFISNLRGVNNGQDFDRQMLSACYASIRDEEIAIAASNAAANAAQHKRSASRAPHSLQSHSQQPASTASASAHSATSSSSRAAANAEGGLQSGEERREVGRQKAAADAAQRSFIELLVRKSLAFLRNSAVQLRGLHQPADSRLVLGMFEASWLRCIAAITVTCESSCDVEALHCCLDGLMLGGCLAVALSLPMERQAFTRVLAKLCFMLKKVGTFSFASLLLHSCSEEAIADCQRQLVQGEQLKQDWYRPLNLYAEKQPLRAIALLQSTCRDAQRKISSERRLQLVRQVQEALGGEVRLSDSPLRSLVRQGKLTKIARDGKRLLYYVWLFNDVLIYASAARQPQRYSFHRCLHLALCRLEDIRRGAAPQLAPPTASPPLASRPPHDSEQSAATSGSPPSSPSASAALSPSPVLSLSSAVDGSVSTTFRIVSPQKSVLLCAGSQEKKQQWLSAIAAQCRLQLSRRRDYIRSIQQQQPATAAASSPSSASAVNDATATATAVESSELLRRWSTFIGSDWTASSSSSASSSPSSSSSSSSFCLLCLRVFSLWRRRLQCAWCNQTVCQQCAQQKAQLPSASSQQPQSDNEKTRVCDACVGVLNGSLSLQSRLLTVVDS